jgi:superfamily II DNA or RNA helicase
MDLRPYQLKAIDDCRKAMQAGRNRVLLVAPTGSGKTVMFAYIAQEVARRGKHVVICAHREELLDQISGTLTNFDVPHGFVAASRKRAAAAPVTVASVQTLVNRLGSITPSLIILDEAHHAVAGSWRQIIDAYPNAKLLGVTATPERLDGSGLGDIFEEMVLGPQVNELQKQGYLTPVKYFTPHTVDLDQLAKRAGEYTVNSAAELMMPTGNIGKVTGQAIEEYAKHANGQRAVVFCVNIIHSQRVAEQFCEAGYRWASLDSKMSKEARRQVVADFRAEALQGVSSCDIISEGFDLPAASVAILLRPTKSLGLYMQQVGRILRPMDGKSHAIVIDHVGNVGKMEDGEFKEEHGFIETERFWSLDGKHHNYESVIPSKRCPECYAMNSIGAVFCAECGHEFQSKSPAPLEPGSGVIVELDVHKITSRTIEQWIETAKHYEILAWARTEEQLKKVADIKGYKSGWAHVIMTKRAHKMQCA